MHPVIPSRSNSLMVVHLLQHANELQSICDGLRIPEPSSAHVSGTRAPLPGGSGLSILFDRGLHFDAAGTCYVWHEDSNCYAIPFNIWSHPASPIRETILRHWPYGEQLSFWPDLFDPSLPDISDRGVGLTPVADVRSLQDPATLRGVEREAL